MRTIPPNEKAFYTRIGQRLKLLRQKSGMTQNNLAAKLGISQPMMASYESGRRRMPMSMLPDVARVLKCEYEDILGGTRSKKKTR